MWPGSPPAGLPLHPRKWTCLQTSLNWQFWEPRLGVSTVSTVLSSLWNWRTPVSSASHLAQGVLGPSKLTHCSFGDSGVVDNCMDTFLEETQLCSNVPNVFFVDLSISRHESCKSLKSTLVFKSQIVLLHSVPRFCMNVCKQCWISCFNVFNAASLMAFVLFEKISENTDLHTCWRLYNVLHGAHGDNCAVSTCHCFTGHTPEKLTKGE